MWPGFLYLSQNCGSERPVQSDTQLGTKLGFKSVSRESAVRLLSFSSPETRLWFWKGSLVLFWKYAFHWNFPVFRNKASFYKEVPLLPKLRVLKFPEYIIWLMGVYFPIEQAVLSAMEKWSVGKQRPKSKEESHKKRKNLKKKKERKYEAIASLNVSKHEIRW